MKRRSALLIITLGLLLQVSILPAQERLTFLYPSPAGSWVIPLVAKEAKYFDGEGLSVELVRVGGSTRIVASRSRRLGMRRVLMIAGTAHAWADNRPERWGASAASLSSQRSSCVWFVLG